MNDPRDEFLPGFAPPPEEDRPRLGAGIHLDVSHDDYHADPAEIPSLSASIARLMVDESPEDAQAEHPRLGAVQRRRKSKDMDRGTILHLLMLGRGQLFHEIEADDYKRKSAQLEREQAERDGLVPVLSRELEEYKRIVGIFVTKLARHRDPGGNPDPIVLDGRSEVTGIWRDEGVLCRCRADHWKDQTLDIFDVKTTLKSLAPSKIAREMYANGTDIQYAAYRRAFGQLANQEGRVRMRFLYLQVRPPYGVLVVEPAGTLEKLGEDRWRRARNRWKVCLADHLSDDEQRRADAWPGHGNNQTVRLPAQPWMLSADADAEILGMGNSDPDF